MPSDLDVTVVTVTWNSQSVIRHFLESVPDAMGDLSWQVVVADNASRDSTAEIVASTMPRARLVQVGRNAGYAAGINAAVKAVGPGTDLLIANPDVMLDSGSGEVLIETVRRPDVGIAVPRLRDADGQLTFSIRRDPTVLRALGEAVLGGGRAGRWTSLGETVTRPEAYERPSDVDWASGAMMAVSRECAERLGAWDETMWLYSEETDYCLRARDAGFRVLYSPRATAMHIGGESNENPVLWTALTVNRVRLFGQRNSSLRTTAFRSAVTLNEALRAAAGRPTSRAALKTLTSSWRLAPPGPPAVSSQDDRA